MNQNRLLEENIQLSYEVHKLKKKLEGAISYGIAATIIAIIGWLI